MENLILYSSIKDQYESTWYVPYEILLNTYEWRNFRQIILQRDNNRCTKCFSEPTEKIHGKHHRKPNIQEILENRKTTTHFDVFGNSYEAKRAITVGIPTENPIILHIHHKHYIFGNAPWNYDKNVLETVCHNCHDEIHKTIKIKVYADETLTEVKQLTPCSKCNGTGLLKEYLHFRNGVCFDCNGLKFEELNA